ncbi:retrovirus-related pol polyprotein from transposon TNT 1-94 [Tanacetum coccineum]|uniref:Retrovirus-related pol polyprotein from transposon TNT 1-94 n=1 Tax=Tanacetum coccineum TaxID=301880 RepID=A0ABQ4Z594_9ASTR
MYLKKAQYEKLCLYEIPYDQSDPANRLVPDREETLTLEKESRSKLNKDLVRPYDYTKLNSLYEIFKPASQEYNEQLAHANEVRKKMRRKYFVKFKTNIFKNISFLPVSKSISKSRQAYNVMTNNINHFRELVDQTWEKHSHNHFRAPTALGMEVLIKTCLMPFAIKTQNHSFTFVHELKQEMHDDLKYVKSLENEIDELKSDKAEFSNIYDILLQECVSNDVMCSYLHSLSDLDAHSELQCLYLHKVKECEYYLRYTKSYYRILYERTSKAWEWWIEQQCPSGYKWVPKTKLKWVPKVRNESVNKRVSFAIDNASRITNIVQLILFIVDSGCTKHMTSNLTLLCNFVEKYLGSVRFGNDEFAPIIGYGDLVQGNITINRVYYVEGLNHNLFSVGQFCDADLEVAFRKSTCFVRDLQGNDLLTGNRGSDLYTISLQETTSSTPICLMAKASPTQAWLWHRRLSHLNFDYINLLSKKDVVIGLPKLKYVRSTLVTLEVVKQKEVHSRQRYTWTLFLRSKDETPEVLKDFLTMIQQNLQALVISVRTDKGTEFLNKTLHAFFKEEGIEHQTSTP